MLILTRNTSLISPNQKTTSSWMFLLSHQAWGVYAVTPEITNHSSDFPLKRKIMVQGRRGKPIFRKKGWRRKLKHQKGKSLCLDTLAKEKLHNNFTLEPYMLPQLRNPIFQTDGMPLPVRACYRAPAKNHTVTMGFLFKSELLHLHWIVNST